jgi:transcription-repair coupling factor (superfamily II helicase)
LDQLNSIMEEMIDRFGPIPEEVRWLYHLSKVKIFANINNFISLKFNSLTFKAC